MQAHLARHLIEGLVPSPGSAATVPSPLLDNRLHRTCSYRPFLFPQMPHCCHKSQSALDMALGTGLGIGIGAMLGNLRFDSISMGIVMGTAIAAAVGYPVALRGDIHHRE